MRQFIRFSSLMLVVSLFFASCEQESSMGLQVPEKVSSPADFDRLVSADLHPFNKLSDEAIREFKAKLKFTPDNQIAGGYLAGIEKELSNAELDLFMRYLLGADSRAGDAATYEASEVESRDCVHRPLYLPNYKNHLFLGCIYELGDFCTICRDNHQ
ncbi:MAG: hypothetical protein AAFP82_00310 [Bacteroidota bacterium]